jgi:hypothetical protein
METRLTRCYAIWIKTKEEGRTLFFGGENRWNLRWKNILLKMGFCIYKMFAN